MIYKRRNGQIVTGKYGLEEKKETTSEITAMLELLGVDSKYFTNMLGIDAYSLGGLTDDLPVCLWVHDEYHAIVHGNSHFLKHYGNCLKRTCYQHLMGEKTHCSCCLSRRALRDDKPQVCKFCKKNDIGYELHSFHIPVTNRCGDKFVLKSSYHVEEIDIQSGTDFDHKKWNCNPDAHRFMNKTAVNFHGFAPARQDFIRRKCGENLNSETP